MNLAPDVAFLAVATILEFARLLSPPFRSENIRLG